MTVEAKIKVKVEVEWDAFDDSFFVEKRVFVYDESDEIIDSFKSIESKEEIRERVSKEFEVIEFF